MASSVVAPWQYRGLGRLEAEKMLVDSKRDGAFLVRESESMKGAHVLSLSYQGKIHHYRVMPSDRGYYIQAVMGLQHQHFQTVEDLVQFYKQPNTNLACRLMYPITATGQDDDDDSDEDDDAESGDEFKMVKFFQASLTAAKVDQMDVDEHFIGLIGKYVNEGMAKDVDSLQTDKRKSPEQFWQLLRSASKDMECELERFRKRLQAIRIFLDRCSGGSHSIAATQDLVPKKADCSPETLATRLSNQVETVRSIEKKAVNLLQQTATMMAPITQYVPPTKDERLSVAVSPIQTFEVQSIHAARVTKKAFLKVDVTSGKLYICKTQDDLQTPHSHDQILQLIKSRSNRVKLGIKLEGKGRRDFQFEDFKQRELFCQLVHQMRNMHSQSKEVDSVSIFIGTWNMGDADPPHAFNSWLKCSGSGKPLDPILACLPHDIYAFGTQESALNEKEWVSRLKNSLNVLVGVNFKQVAAQTLWGIRLVILVKEEHFNKISHVQQSTVKTGIAGVAGNKGGTGISFFFNGTSLCFVNSHLTSGSERCQRRNNNFYDILRCLQVGQSSRKTGGVFDLTHQCHHVFWFGDLNYRIDLEVEEIFQHVSTKEYIRLLDCDQLKIEQGHGRAFSSFEEEEINFPPTYRYKRGTRIEYEYKKFKKTGVRINVPSYCDRILLSSFPGLQVNNSSYGCTNDIMTSDHSPVFATYTVGITAQFIPASSTPEQEKNERGTQICVQNIYAAIRTSSSTTFYLEIHSSCLESVVRSKRNSSFSSASSRHWFDLPNGGQENAHYTYPEWSSNDFDQIIHPILPDQGYLQQQHLLIAVKSVEDDESYGECVISLCELLTPNPNVFECKLTHRGMGTGLLSGLMHLPWDSSESTTTGSTSNYEIVNSFISNDDEDESQMPSQSQLRQRSVMSSPPRWRSIHQKTSQDDDSNRFRSQSHRSDVSKEMLNGSVTTANGFVPTQSERRPKSNPHFGSAPKQRKDPKRGNDVGSSLEPSSVLLTFPDDSRSKPQARGPPPLPPRGDEESGTSVPPLPLKGYSRDSKIPSQRPAIPLHKRPPYSVNRPSSAPSSPTQQKLPPFGTDRPQISPSVASCVAQIAAQNPGSPVRNKVPAFQVPNRPLLALKPKVRPKDSVAKWLLEAGVPSHYAAHLIQSGWDDPSFFLDISDSDLRKVGITDREHRQKIVEKARRK